MITVPLAIALVIGFSAHFLSSGADNVFRMAPGEWRLSFQISAVLLVCLEALGCWIGLRAFELILGLSSTSKVEDLWTTRLGTAYCHRTPFSLIVVALCAMQNSSHLILPVIKL